MSSTPTQRFLSDAELVLGLSRHLGTYEVGPAHASLAELEFAGRAFEMAWRLRGSGLSTISRVLAIGLEAFIPKRQLLHEVLPVLDSLGWVELNRDKDGAVVEVDERIPPPAELLQLAESILVLTTVDWDRIIAINLKGIWRCMMRELAEISDRGGGAIVNMSSVAGVAGFRSPRPTPPRSSPFAGSPGSPRSHTPTRTFASTRSVLRTWIRQASETARLRRASSTRRLPSCSR
jgi:NAD(P)-dependent dehydrogenase (short-subunit alcohol dehydrogenase family)